MAFVDDIRQASRRAADEGAQKISRKFKLGPAGGALALAGVTAALYSGYFAAKTLGRWLEKEREFREKKKVFDRNSSAFAFSTGYASGKFPELEGAGRLDVLTQECLRLGKSLEKAYAAHSPQMFDIEDRYSLAARLLEGELKAITKNSKILLDQRVQTLKNQVSFNGHGKGPSRKDAIMRYRTARRNIRHADIGFGKAFGAVKGLGKRLVSKIKSNGNINEVLGSVKGALKEASDKLNKHPKGKKALQVSGAALGAIAVLAAGIAGFRKAREMIKRSHFEGIPKFINFVNTSEYFAGEPKRRLAPFLSKLEQFYNEGEREKALDLFGQIDEVCGEIIQIQTDQILGRAQDIERVLSAAEKEIKTDAMFRRRFDKAMRRCDLIEKFPGGFTEPVKDPVKNFIATKYDPEFAKFQSALYAKQAGLLRKLLEAVKKAFQSAKRGLGGTRAFEVAAKFCNNLAGKSGSPEQKRALKKLAIGLGIAAAASAGIAAISVAVSKKGRRGDYQGTLAFINSYEAGRYPEVVSPEMNSAVAAMKAADAAGDMNAFWAAAEDANVALEASKRKYMAELQKAQMVVYANEGEVW